MILHHYPNSPFAEKIRAIFGYKGIAWHSVVQPDIMPKPDLQALTGAYRRIPVLQIGSDIYCDTALIVQILENLYPSPALQGAANRGVLQTIAQWADDALFWAAMGHNFKGAAALFATLPPEMAAQTGKAFAQDRAAMFGATPRQRANEATAAYKQYLQRIASMLAGQSFMFGESPTLADFACYHPLWFTVSRVPQMASIFDETPVIKPWLERMQVFSAAGQTLRTEMSPEQAIAIALHGTPVPFGGTFFTDEHGIALGSQVAITAEKFGLEATVGELVAATSTQLTLRRLDDRAGLVHVHFPRLGFVMKLAE